MKKQLFSIGTQVKHDSFFNILKHLFLTKLKSKKARKVTVVFDIDGCIVDAFGNKDNKIQPVIDFYNLCLKFDVIPYIVTARPAFESNIKHTMEMLKEVIKPTHPYWFENVFFMNENLTDPYIYKHEARKHISKHKKILLTIGDNWCDIDITNKSMTSVLMKLKDKEYITFSSWN